MTHIKLVSSAMTQHDVKNFHNFLFKESIERITYGNALVFDEPSRTISQSKNYREVIRQTPYFWLIFSTGVEFLIKATLLKNHVLDIAARTARGRASHSLNEITQVYELADSHIVVAKHDQTLNDKLRQQGVLSIWSLNIPSLIQAADPGIKALEQQNLINKNQAKLLRERIHCFANIRRNIECHVFLGISITEFDHEISQVYLPMINDLIALF